MSIFYDINEDKLDAIAKYISKAMKIDKQEALSIVYEEYDLIEEISQLYKKPKDIAKRFIADINNLYKIA